MSDGITSLRHEIESAIRAGVDASVLLPKFTAFADEVQQRLDRTREELITLEMLSLTDALTGISNRRALDRRLSEELGKARRERRHLAVVFIDIDRFKAFNDIYGHVAGDQALATIAGILRTSLRRPGDFLARYGGEEFVALLPGVNEHGAHSVAEQLRLAIRAAAIAHDGSAVDGIVTASFGVASFIPLHERDCKEPLLLNLADAALRRAKASGRDRVHIHDFGGMSLA